jgi:hypothetical protein
MMKFKYAFFVLVLINGLIVMWGLSKTFFEDPLTQDIQVNKPGLLNLKAVLTNHKQAELNAVFPKQKFRDSINYESASEVAHTINQTLGIIKGDSIETYRFFVKELLEPNISKDTMQEFNSAVLLRQLNAGVNFKALGQLDPKATLYADAIADQYFQLVSNQLTKFQEKKPELVNQFSFQYLVQRVGEYNYYPNRKETSADKFLKTFLENDYFHLMNTSWQKSSIMQKISMFIFVGFFLLGLLSVLTYIIKRIKA